MFWSCYIGELPTCGFFGCGGWCFGEESCTECPKLLCPSGGPKPGPPPPNKPQPIPTPSSKPGDKPEDPPKPADKPRGCQEKDHRTATEEMVFCIVFIDLSSAIQATTISTRKSTTVTTAASTTTTCHTPWSFEMFGCDVTDHRSTTTATVTKSNSISSSSKPAHACTRAPLSLDDDEGNNIPEENCQDCSDYFNDVCVPKQCKDDPEYCAAKCLTDMCMATESQRYCHTGKCKHESCPEKVDGCAA
jgi:hypothetical protein